MEMDAKKVELLLRAALLDDSKNINERFAALVADIEVDDDGMVCITLDMDLWPEDKVSPEVEAIAKMLMFDVEWVGAVGTSPFAWPGIGEQTNRATEYFKMVLDAYRGQQSKGNE